MNCKIVKCVNVTELALTLTFFFLYEDLLQISIRR